jgi:hypothetical protein
MIICAIVYASGSETWVDVRRVGASGPAAFLRGYGEGSRFVMTEWLLRDFFAQFGNGFRSGVKTKSRVLANL